MAVMGDMRTQNEGRKACPEVTLRQACTRGSGQTHGSGCMNQTHPVAGGCDEGGVGRQNNARQDESRLDVHADAAPWIELQPAGMEAAGGRLQQSGCQQPGNPQL